MLRAGKSDVEGRLPPPTSSPAPLSELRAALETFCFEPTAFRKIPMGRTF